MKYFTHAFLVIFSIVASFSCSQHDEKVNILVIFSDDHGYSDLSCQEVFGDVKTPNIDFLAENGVRMTDGYVTAPQCVPSRGGLITGRFQSRWHALYRSSGGKNISIMSHPPTFHGGWKMIGNLVQRGFSDVK